MSYKRHELNGELDKLLDMTSRGPAKTVRELSEMVRLLSLVVIDMHLQMKFAAGSRLSRNQELASRIVAPLLVGGLLWLLFEFGPAVLKLLP